MILFFVTNDIFSLSFPGILGATYIGIFEMGMTFLLWLTALSKTEKTNKISQLVYISPFLSLILISIILGETILLSSFVGLIFIITGIVFQSKIK
jgi:drug/metabolite transporter (DMT)-like permease